MLAGDTSVLFVILQAQEGNEQPLCQAVHEIFPPALQILSVTLILQQSCQSFRCNHHNGEGHVTSKFL